MRGERVLARLVGVERAVVEAVRVDDEALVVRVRPRRRDASRCGVCGRRAGGYDRGEGARRWRALDLGTTRAYVEAAAPRVDCRRHGVVVARTAWARHGSRFTRAFEQQVAWLATQCSKTAVCELMRIGWPTVGRIIERVVVERAAAPRRSARGAEADRDRRALLCATRRHVTGWAERPTPGRRNGREKLGAVRLLRWGVWAGAAPTT